jgi:hypothetical protein
MLIIVAFWVKDPRSEFRNYIDAPIEAEVAEAQKGLEALEVENIQDDVKA